MRLAIACGFDRRFLELERRCAQSLQTAGLRPGPDRLRTDPAEGGRLLGGQDRYRLRIAALTLEFGSQQRPQESLFLAKPLPRGIDQRSLDRPQRKPASRFALRSGSVVLCGDVCGERRSAHDFSNGCVEHRVHGADRPTCQRVRGFEVVLCSRSPPDQELHVSRKIGPIWEHPARVFELAEKRREVLARELEIWWAVGHSSVASFVNNDALPTWRLPARSHCSSVGSQERAC